MVKVSCSFGSRTMIATPTDRARDERAARKRPTAQASGKRSKKRVPSVATNERTTDTKAARVEAFRSRLSVRPASRLDMCHAVSRRAATVSGLGLGRCTTIAVDRMRDAGYKIRRAEFGAKLEQRWGTCNRRGGA